MINVEVRGTGIRWGFGVRVETVINDIVILRLVFAILVRPRVQRRRFDRANCRISFFKILLTE
jgi:hypothetical protein